VIGILFHTACSHLNADDPDSDADSDDLAPGKGDNEIRKLKGDCLVVAGV
jgi:hypothetical protein